MGRVCEAKRPDRLLDVARACSDPAFDLVGLWYETDYSRRTVERARQASNIIVHGRVSCVWDYCRLAVCLLCTSDFEGFPNTFLAAWSQSVPVVSTFDPDDLIARRELGLVAGDLPSMAAAVRRLLESPGFCRRLSQNARQYYPENRTVEVAKSRFEQVFLKALGG